MGEKVSIITISYNSQKSIEATMCSVLEQTYRPLEYVLVDGGSTDGTIQLIESYIPKFHEAGIETNFKSEPDKGISDAFNKGIERSTGDIIGIINSDDRLSDKQILKKIVDSFDSDCEVICGDILWADEVNNMQYVRKSSMKLKKLKYDMALMHPACFVKKTAYQKYGTFDVEFRYAMDKDLMARFYSNGVKFQRFPEVTTIMSAGGASDENAKKVFQEGVEIGVRNGVPRWVMRTREKYKTARLKLINIWKRGGVQDLERLRRRPYLYDLYRWTGKTDFRTWVHWMGISKYRVVYLFRKCKKYKDKNKVLFCFWRAIYGHYATKYGVDLGTTTQIGSGFIIRHVGGIAINGGVIIGKDCEILQGVTIGYERRGKRQGNPTIGDRVWIGSNAIIVGNIKVGNNVLIAPGAFVNFDVPDNSIVIGNPGKIIPSEKATEGYVVNTLDI